MKRVYSFIVMCFTILILVVASLPSIKSNKTLSTQFSKGTELVYKISSWDEDGVVTEAQVDKTIKVLQERIDASGLGLYEVSYLGNDYIRVICPETELGISRTENDPDELQRVYDEGRRIALQKLNEVKKFLEI